MWLRPFDVLVAGALIGGSVPARAQLVVTPESLRVVLEQGQEAMTTVTLTNAGAAPFPFCLDVLRPGQAHHPLGSLGAGCGPLGERLFLRERSVEHPLGDALAITMTPEGRLFIADYGSRSTWEYDSELNYVRDFLHPRVVQLSPVALTTGVSYDQRTGTMWWTNREGGSHVLRTLLLEGTLDGVATGRRIEVLVPTGDPPAPTLVGGLFDPASGLFYFVDSRTQGNKLWAVDTLGVVVPGYPVGLAHYPNAQLGDGLDLHGGEGGDPLEVRADVPLALAGQPHWTRVVVTDAVGRDLGLETPIPPFPPGWDARLAGTALRSRLDPNGVMYGAFSGRDASGELVDGLFAFRPTPLSPSWLALSEWMGAVAPAGSASVTLTFRAGDRTPGEYTSTLVVEDATGAVLASVPLTLVVEEATPAEPGPESQGLTLTVSPNPSSGAATVTLTLTEPARVCLVAYDVLGRAVAELADESMAAGAHVVAFGGAALPAGVYVLRGMVEPDRGSAGTYVTRLTLVK